MAFDPVSAVLEIGGKVIDRLWPDPAQREAAKVKLAELQQTGELAVMANETETLKAVLADVASARDREAKIAISENAPTLNKVITPVLALVVTLGGGVMLWYSQDGDTKMAVVGLMTLVLGYYFGTSQGSTKANQLFRDIARKSGG
jgi:hypothetical protein